MSKTIEFYFDFGSPTSYLAYRRLQQLEEKYRCEIDYKPVLLGAILKESQNTSPAMIPKKGQYMMGQDLPRFAKRYNVKIVMNPFFPINTLPLMRGAHAAKKLDCFLPYCDAVFDALWVDGGNLGDIEVVSSTLDRANIDATALLALISETEIKQSLMNLTNEAVERGVFGAPTMFVGKQMYFGQDRCDFIEEELAT